MLKPSLLKNQAEMWTDLESRRDTQTIHEINRVKESLGRIQQEEERYIRAYGTGTMEFEVFQGIIKEVKQRKSSYSEQLTALNEKLQEKANSGVVEELYQEAIEVIKSLETADKTRIIRDLIEKVTIEANNTVKVWAHIPRTTEKVGFKNGDRNCRLTQCW